MLSKTIPLIWKLIALAIGLFLLSLFFDRGVFMFDFEMDKGFEVETVQQTIADKVTIMDSLLVTIKNEISANEYCELVATEEYPECKSLFEADFLDHIPDQGFTVFIFKDYDLKYWSDSSVPAREGFIDSCRQSKVLNVGNGFYIPRIVQHYNRLIIGLVQIKKEFSFENEYLKPQFAPGFDIQSSVQLSLTDTTENSVYNTSGHFLFSLTPMVFSRSEKPFFYHTIIAYFLCIILIVIIIILKLRTVVEESQAWMWFPLLAAIVVFVRYLMTIQPIPGNFYFIELFQPQIYAGSGLSPSLGDFLFNVVLLLIFAYYLTVPVASSASGKVNISLHRHHFLLLPFGVRYGRFFPGARSFNAYAVLVFLLLIPLIFSIIPNSFRNIVVHSTLSFDLSNFAKLSVYTGVALFALGLLLAAFIIILDKVVVFCLSIVNTFQYVVLSVLAFVLFAVYAYLFWVDIDFVSYTFLITLFVVVSHLHVNKRNYGYYTLAFIILIATLFTTVFITRAGVEKEKELRALKVNNLAFERDGVAEKLFLSIDEQMTRDNTLQSYFQTHNFTADPQTKYIDNYLMKRYFHDPFWRKYNIRARICGSASFFSSDNNLDNCIAFYSELVKEKGIKLPNSNYYFMNNMNGSISYLGFYEYISRQDSSNITMFLSLDSKLVSDIVGYPELLMDKELKKKVSSIPTEYSYAKYLDNDLVSKKGSYPYSLVKQSFFRQDSDLYVVRHDNYSHTIYNVDQRNTIILSKPELRFIDVLITFAYIFLFFNFLLFVFRIYRFVASIRLDNYKFYFGFKNKILIAMISVLLISFIIVGSGTVYLEIEKYEDKHRTNISEKIESVVTEIEQRYPEVDMLQRDWKTGGYEFLEEDLNNMSLTFFIDINVFDTDGKLIASSRPEVFNKELIARRMHPDAYRQLKLYKRAKFLHDERMGNSNFSSVYMPFRDPQNKVVAYINLPYFTKPGLLSKEISTLIVTVVNLYVVLLLVTVVIAIFLSDKITYPLRLLQQKFQKIELGRINEQIFYDSKDEIGGLVKEYNRMVVELEKSVNMLAKNERESAWREMAKQIAHEIKNPLTPMKLSIQFLQRSWSETENGNYANFKKRLDGVAKTLVEQINSLSTIATEFSNFAKMPQADNQYIDVIEIVTEAVRLFENSEEATVRLIDHKHKDVVVFADKERLSRVFINLLKNATQAIPAGKDGYITASIFANKRIVRVKVEDNGTGIPEELKHKLFTPSFTTKNSGMGMGLAIVKNIVENAGGTIWFETELNKGTRFFVELPRTPDAQA